MKPRKPTVLNGGLYASHDMSCPIHGCAESAVLDLSDGIFQPCWKHQGKGFLTVKLGPVMRWLVGWFND